MGQMFKAVRHCLAQFWLGSSHADIMAAPELLHSERCTLCCL